MNESEFPPTALSYLEEQYPDHGRTRYFLESGSDSVNFETKFKWQGSCYSIEFFKDGSLKDTEKQVKYASLEAGLMEVLNDRFRQDFKKWKVKKVQEQTLPGRPGLRYEIEVKGKSEEGWAFFEYLFEADGPLVLKRKIILPSNNITLY